ncbi:MAG: family 78 glycoside hydrolase catalytic domain [Dysgonamonadaceae bacterium]|nr:family 78 glycoside hydrolase catalytic domain [Dysgonamonadaceae bacterium]
MQFNSYNMVCCIKKTFLIAIISHVMCLPVISQAKLTPVNLSVNRLYNTEQTFLNGYPTTTPLNESLSHKENFQFVEISTHKPQLGWIINATTNNTLQTSYRILLASDFIKLQNDDADLWDSGKVDSNQSINIQYEGKPLEASKIYYWKVKVWDNHGNESDFSEVSQFKTSDELTNYFTDRYPLQKQDDSPLLINQTDKGNYFVDFGKASFGRVRIKLYAESINDSIIIHLGEAKQGEKVNRSPGGTIRYAKYLIYPKVGWNTYIITIKPDKRNTGSQAILMPKYIGEVTPFRYCEIENYSHNLKETDITRETVFYPFNELESYFHSSDTVLNQVWDISKYTIKATSFLGVYMDGDRERIPYEGDALINQLSHYSVARDFSMARYSHEYLVHHPTWPTEWILQSVLIAWEDYMHTGDSKSLENFYTDLKAKTLSQLSDDDGFISTRTGKVTPEVLKSIHFNGGLNDLVDWPYGERDGFVFTEINTVVNAYHYRTLTIMSDVAKLLGKNEESFYYKNKAIKLKKVFNKRLFDKKLGYYIDGVGTNHSSRHANMFPLAFGLVPEKKIESVMKFIRSRGMVCSVYGSQFLLDVIFNMGDAQYGLDLLTSTSERSWYNMIRAGSTMTMEAWDIKYKHNQDWNHAWGAAPANLISRKLMGIEPLEAGFEKMRIKPQPGSLKSAEIKHPTIKGDVYMKFHNTPDKSFNLELVIPANTKADVYLPYYSKKQKVTLNDESIKFRREGKFSIIENMGSGKWTFHVEK